MTTTHRAGQVYYIAHPEMDHGVRPQVLMATADGQGLVMPLSTGTCRQLGHTEGYYIARTDTHKARGHAAPNRTHRVALDTLPAPDGYLTHEELMVVWDAWDEYRTPRRVA